MKKTFFKTSGMLALAFFGMTTILGGGILAGCSADGGSSSEEGSEQDSQNNGNGNSSNNGNSENAGNSGNSGNGGNGSDNTVTPGGSDATGILEEPTAATPVNASVKIVKSSGWFNSAYIVFEQLSGATSYKVLCDDVEIDEPLIRYYDTYTYNELTENSDLSISYAPNSLQNVVRADALGLKAGSHEIKVCAVKADGETEYSSVNVTVVDYDRSGFAFADGHEPGAYKKDGTLKDGAIVIYLTNDNINTVSQTFTTLKGKTETLTGIQAITQYVKIKNISTPVDIRVIGKLYATKAGELSCADLNSAWALGVKQASQVTIEGVGHDATLYGAGLAAFQSENIEFSNLGLMKWGGGKDGDGVSLKADSYAWVHNCDVFYGDAGSDGDQVKGDGSMDMKDDSNHVTVSYNHFWDSGKMSLCGMKSETGPNYITYHHNWFDHSDSRHPRIRTMTVHVYNNYFDGNAKYGVGVTTGASCFVEGNFFRNAHDPMLSSKQGTDAQGAGTFSGEKGGVIKSYNNKFEQNSTNGVKFQFITNKYDYTNNKALGEYKEWYETVGTDNGDGTWTIYDAKVSDTDDTFATNSLVAIEDAAKKGAYYQISKGKTGFYIDVPANTKEVIVKAKCGSSGKSGTAEMLSVNGTKVTMDMAADYTEYTVPVSVSSDSTIEIENVNGSNSMNVKEIKVVATSGWNTKLTSGADLTNIDAYEVDDRKDQVPAAVKTRSGGTMYSNFDVAMGDSGMGIAIAPTDPDTAKSHVLKYSGRHESDFAYAFTNSTDDASYTKNDALNEKLVNYTTGFKKVQGYTQQATTTTGGDTPSTGEDTTTDKGGSDDQTVTAISVSANPTSISSNGTTTLTATITGDDTATVTWAITSNSSAAALSTTTSVAVGGVATVTLTGKDPSSAKTVKVTATAGGKTSSAVSVSVAAKESGGTGDTNTLEWVSSYSCSLTGYTSTTTNRKAFGFYDGKNKVSCYQSSAVTNFSFVPTTAGIIKVYIAADNSKSSTITAEIDDVTIVSGSIPQRDDTNAAPFEINVTAEQVGKTVVIKPAYKAILFKIE